MSHSFQMILFNICLMFSVGNGWKCYLQVIVCTQLLDKGTFAKLNPKVKEIGGSQSFKKYLNISPLKQNFNLSK